MVSIERIYRTKAYDKVLEYTQENPDFFLADIWDKQLIVNLILPLIRKEEREKLKKVRV